MNDNIFDVIDTKEKAYWLGFLYADGYIGINNKKLQICLSIVDEKQIDDFIKFVGDTLDKKRYYGPYKTSGKQVHYRTCNKTIIAGLVKHGCTNKKSHTIRFPQLSTEEINISFLRGYYDGDGSSGKKLTAITCGSRLFFEDMKIIFNLPNVIYKTKSSYETYRMNIGAELYRKMIEIYPFGIYKKGANFDGLICMKDYKILLSEIRQERLLKKEEIKFIRETKRKEINEEKNKIKRIRLIEREKNKEIIKAKRASSDGKRRKFEVSKEDLQKLIDTTTARKIGEMFGVSDKAIAKRCKVLGIALKGKGYWSKMKSLKLLDFTKT